MSTLVAGVFVGGGGTRMGGLPKGLLRTSDGVTLVERMRGLLVAAGAEVVLVGASDAYASMGLESVPDEPRGVGPLGGLASLLRRAGGAPTLALACDLPYVSATLLARLVSAPPAPIVAPKRDGRWEPLCARYDPAQVLPVIDRLLVARRHALQAVLDEARAVALPLSDAETLELHDWDVPSDVPRPRS
jgi:molybdopterin-guanine dinucleotide biosynthesis protein A